MILGGIVMGRIGEFFTRRRLFWILCTLLALLPSAVMEGTYAPVLDDYIMYDGFHLYDVSYLLGTVKVWTTRPVSTLLDVFLWSRFHDCLFLLFLLLTVMRVAAVSLFARFFEEHGWEGVTMPLCLLLLFCPLGVEATGWISASSRIITGMLFLGIALMFLNRNRYGRFFLFLVLSFGCYEQFIFLGFCLAVYDLWFRNKKMIWMPFFAGFAMAGYYLFCNRWNSTSRMSFEFNWNLFSQMKEGWSQGVFRLIPESIRRGCMLFPEYWWVGVLLIMVTVLLVLVWTPLKNTKKFSWLMGIALFTACHLPFWILRDNGLSFRVLYLPLMGVALLFCGGKGSWRRILCAVLVFFFSVGTMGELKDYQIAGQRDYAELQSLADDVKNNQITAKEQMYFHEPSVRYGQHILSVFHSEWSFTAGMRSVTENIKIQGKLIK